MDAVVLKEGMNNPTLVLVHYYFHYYYYIRLISANYLTLQTCCSHK